MSTTFFDWEAEDFEGHPDESALQFNSVGDLPDGVRVQICQRSGRGHVLPDGLLAFPGVQHVELVVTVDQFNDDDGQWLVVVDGELVSPGDRPHDSR